MWHAGALLVCHAAPMAKIAAEVRGALRAPLVDNSGVTGTYDLKLLYMPDDRVPEPDQIPAPRLSEALDDVGLKLRKTTAPTEVLVIDHLEKATEN